MKAKALQNTEEKKNSTNMFFSLIPIKKPKL